MLPHHDNVADFTLPHRSLAIVSPGQLSVHVHWNLHVLELKALGCARAHKGRRCGHTRARRTADREARARTDRPFVGVLSAAPLQKAETVPLFFLSDQAVLLIQIAGLLANLNVLVRPSVLLVGLLTREVSGACDVVDTGSDEAPTYQIDGVMVVQVHGSPPQPADVEQEESSHTREAEAHE